jgi:hypothetical protein
MEQAEEIVYQAFMSNVIVNEIDDQVTFLVERAEAE